MPNPKGNAATLKPTDSPWKNKPTKTIRIPVIFEEQALEYVHKLDDGGVRTGNSHILNQTIASGFWKGQSVEDVLIDIVGALEDVVNGKVREYNASKKQKLEKLISALQSTVTVIDKDKLS